MSKKTKTPKISGIIIVPIVASLLLAVGLTTGGGQANAAASQTSTQRFSMPVDFVHPVSTSGCFEDIHLTGQLNVLIHSTFTDSGKVLMKIHFNPQGIKGVGLTTGINYQGTGVTQEVVNTNVGSEFTSVNNFNLIGQGSTPNTDSIEHQVIHFTVNANGDVTANIDKQTSTCR